MGLWVFQAYEDHLVHLEVGKVRQGLQGQKDLKVFQDPLDLAVPMDIPEIQVQEVLLGHQEDLV